MEMDLGWNILLPLTQKKKNYNLPYGKCHIRTETNSNVYEKGFAKSLSLSRNNFAESKFIHWHKVNFLLE